MSAISIQGQPSRFRVGWGILMFIAVASTLGHIGLLLFDPGFATGFIAWATFEFLLAAILAIPYRRGERWAWYVVWAPVIPYAVVIFFNPDVGPFYLAAAALIVLGQWLASSAFFAPGGNA